MITTFQEVIFPISVDDFLHRYWEREPLYIFRDNPYYYNGLINFDDFEQLILSTWPGPENILASRIDPLSGLGHYKNYSADDPHAISKILFDYASGFTIALFGLTKRSQAVHQLVRSAEQLLLGTGSAGLYAKAGEPQGFRIHKDPHDSYVLQLEGIKQWTIYEPQRLFPIPHDDDSYEVDESTLGSSILQVELHPGDMLYVPRGFVHEVRSNAAALSLSLIFRSCKRSDLLQETVNLLIARNPELRRSVQGSFVAFTLENHQHTVHSIRDACLQALSDEVVEQAIENIKRNMTGTIVPSQRGKFSQALRVTSLSHFSVLRKREGNIFHLEKTPAGLILTFPGGCISLQPELLTMLRFILEREQFTLDELSGTCGHELALPLVQRLVIEGFLFVEDSLTPILPGAESSNSSGLLCTDSP
ncbi:JmjC domain-containing protein [Gloeobacter kilaueensis]|uniref:JmjC domain-containing protein n=1 Tax=Gloeobacter kilaueensis (strain ATCC BAA-2537 / CCAP 1431/1 / ULC 316 / JS1) TaxID=1183438 RepID=U5QK64_GLOK1|nr:cupin domain-containing protein [Gloeobacter kilaueensis]AGY58014.1 hypothetical protein GKIL_1768 [Gloeobacter kilaueensis JS1]